MGIPYDDQPADRVEVALHSDTTAIVSLIGEHDLSLGDALRGALETAAEHRSCVLVDLSRCTLLDSTGIAALLDAQNRVRAAEGRVSRSSSLPARAPWRVWPSSSASATSCRLHSRARKG